MYYHTFRETDLNARVKVNLDATFYNFQVSQQSIKYRSQISINATSLETIFKIGRTHGFTSLILNIFSWGEVHIPCFVKNKRILKRFMLTCCSFLRNLEQRHSVFARGCVEKYSGHGNIP